MASAASVAVFAAGALAFTWVSAARRFADLTQALPRMQAAYDRVSAAGGRPRQALEFGLQPPSQQVNQVLAHVATLTLVFACVVALMAVLVTCARAGFAVLAAAAATSSAALGAGPLSLIAGTVSVPATAVYGIQRAPAGSTAAAQAFADYQNAAIAFSTPTWLRLAVAGALALLLAATFFALRRAAGEGRANPGSPRLTSALAVAYLLLVGLLGVGDTSTLSSGDYDGPALVALLGSSIGLGVAAIVAGACLAGRRHALPALALTVLIGLATYTMWAAHNRPGGAPQVFGWVDMGSDAPIYGTLLMTGAVLAAVPLGWAAGTTVQALARRTRPASTTPVTA